MTFLDLPAGATVFLDANTLVHTVSNHPRYSAPCEQLLQRIEKAELHGITSTHVLSEAAHRLMTLEAITLHGWPQAGIAARMRNHPAEVQRLTNFRPAIERIPKRGVQILTISPILIEQALAISQQTGLLHNDALVVAIMQQHSLTNLASIDSDFDRVRGLTRYAPL